MKLTQKQLRALIENTIKEEDTGYKVESRQELSKLIATELFVIFEDVLDDQSVVETIISNIVSNNDEPDVLFPVRKEDYKEVSKEALERVLHSDLRDYVDKIVSRLITRWA